MQSDCEEIMDTAGKGGVVIGPCSELVLCVHGGDFSAPRVLE